ncbi:DNA topoisomerase III, partial [Clostridioides difficile]|nr:DNA topoisomerase III [Clostridioides difficile]MDB3745773.1 DNA topoisomerase III [Clostridioides difficile]
MLFSFTRKEDLSLILVIAEKPSV